MQDYINLDNNNLPIITSYGNNFIKINNVNKINNNLLLFSNGQYKNVQPIKEINIDNIRNLLLNYSLNKDIFLVGCGDEYIIPSFEIRSFVKKIGFSLEWMITKSAIHTWNILLEEYRDIIFLLLWGKISIT